jgi:hypothetical protein
MVNFEHEDQLTGEHEAQVARLTRPELARIDAAVMSHTRLRDAWRYSDIHQASMNRTFRVSAQGRRPPIFAAVNG